MNSTTEAESRGLNLAKELIRSVVRSFYETRHIIIVDALVRHSAIRDDDLAYILQLNIKDVHKMCGFMREARLLAVHTRAEQREGQQRANNRTYYYINYPQSVDAIKWRVYQLSKSVQKAPAPATERKDYFCPRCKSEWTQLEVIDNCGPTGFLCHKCNGLLQHDPTRNAGGHEKSSEMNKQLRFITDILQKIDAVRVPEHNFDVAIGRRMEVARDHTHMVAATTVVEPSRPTAVKGRTDIGPKTIQVAISTADGPTEAEKQAERERKEKLAKQNALPAWMVQSTVSGESFGGSNPNPSPAVEQAEEAKNGRTAVDAAKDHAELDDVLERLKAEQAAMVDEDEFEEEEDEYEFEDVAVGNSAIASPMPSLPADSDLLPKNTEEIGARNDEEEDFEFEDV